MALGRLESIACLTFLAAAHEAWTAAGRLTAARLRHACSRSTNVRHSVIPQPSTAGRVCLSLERQFTVVSVSLKDRFCGCLLGLAVGDALGARFEGQYAAFIRQHAPTVEQLIHYDVDELWYTDDTQMAIGVAETLATHKTIMEDRLCEAFLACFALTPHSYEHAIGNVILLGGDTDTMAAMAGAVAGAFLGAAGIPAALVEKLEDHHQGRTYLVELADRLYAVHQSLDKPAV